MRQNFPIRSAILSMSAGAPVPNKQSEGQMIKDEDCKNRVLYAGGSAGLRAAAARPRTRVRLGRGGAGGCGRLRADAGTDDLRVLPRTGRRAQGSNFTRIYNETYAHSRFNRFLLELTRLQKQRRRNARRRAAAKREPQRRTSGSLKPSKPL